MNNGWIKIHRKLLDNPISRKPNYLSLWILLLLKANHEPNSFIWNKKKQTCNRGQFLTGRKQLSIESGISAGTIENILNYLESEHQIEQQKTSKFRLITIKNYNKYQDTKQEIEQQNDNRMTTELQQNDTNKNDKNDKNDKKDINSESEILLNKQIGEIFNAFKGINPLINFGHRGERKACTEMIKAWGYEKTLKMAAAAVSIQGKPYSPVITNPYQLKIKSSELAVSFQKEQANLPKII